MLTLLLLIVSVIGLLRLGKESHACAEEPSKQGSIRGPLSFRSSRLAFERVKGLFILNSLELERRPQVCPVLRSGRIFARPPDPASTSETQEEKEEQAQTVLETGKEDDLFGHLKGPQLAS